MDRKPVELGQYWCYVITLSFCLLESDEELHFVPTADDEEMTVIYSHAKNSNSLAKS